MNVFTLNPVELQRLEQAFEEGSYLALQDVDLPDTFHPPHAEVTFLEAPEVPGWVEVYIDSRARYAGTSSLWREIEAEPEQLEETRFLAQVEGDFRVALRLLKSFLVEAGGSIPDASPESAASAHRERGDSNPEGRAEEREASVLPSGGRRVGADPRPTGLRDLVEASRRHLRSLTGRERELQETVTSLLRETKPGVVLVGPPGCGKTTLVEMLAGKIAAGDVPAGLKDTPVYELPLGSLLESTVLVGDLERQLRGILDLPGRPVFFADEIHQLSRSELRPLLDLLKPALARGTVRMIGTTTPTEWRQVQDRAFRRRFVQIDLSEPSLEETLQMLRPRARSLGEHHGVAFSERNLKEAILLAACYLPGRSFPDKAIDLLDHAAAMQNVDQDTEDAALSETGTGPASRRADGE